MGRLEPEAWRYRVRIADGDVVREICAVSLAEALRLARSFAVSPRRRLGRACAGTA